MDVGKLGRCNYQRHVVGKLVERKGGVGDLMIRQGADGCHKKCMIGVLGHDSAL